MIYIAAGDTLSRNAKEAINNELSANGEIVISPFSAWEFGLLAAKGKLVVTQKPESWFAAFLQRSGVTLAPLTPDILIASSFLPAGMPKDPADRIIVATARECNYTLVTRDRALLAYADAGHVAALEC